jgi:hypothetical protein
LSDLHDSVISLPSIASSTDWIFFFFFFFLPQVWKYEVSNM